jgi:uncharacterized protein
MSLHRVPPEVADRLGYYVYIYVDPRSGRPFYVGKGRGRRILAHLSSAGESRKARVLAELRAEGREPGLEVLAHGLADEETAFRVEAAAIDLLGLEDLTNAVRGWRSVQLGRLPLSELMTYYAAKPVEVTDPVLLIRINQLYRHGMPAHELYEATRGVWRLGARCQGAKYALAVFEGVVREAYQIDEWHAAGTTPYTSRDAKELAIPGRQEFLGQPASESIRDRYVGKSVAAYFKRGQQSPVVYVNC